MNNTHFKQSLTANLFKKIAITVAITAITFIILLLYSYEVYHRYIFQEYDFIYQFAQLIKDNLITISICLITVDTIIIFWLRYKESLLYIEKMLEAGKVLVANDDTLISLPYELKEIEDQMNLIKKQSLDNKKAVESSIKQKDDLLLYLAHDLKTPLTSILGYLNLLVNQPNLSLEKRIDYTKIAYDKALRLEELIEEFFTITKFNLSDLSINKQTINISLMLEQISYEFKPLYQEKNLKCITNIEDNLSYELDVNLFERVFDNLIRNAINYSINDSSIIINTYQKNQAIVIDVANFTNNIDIDSLEHVFEPFVRLDKSRNSETGGSGLGLAITKQIIEEHNGTIEVNYHDNMIIFSIRLPY